MSDRDFRTGLAWGLLALLAFLILVLGMLILSGGGRSWGALDHPQFPTLQHSGWSLEDNRLLLACVWLLGVLQIILYLALLGLGLAGRAGGGRLRALLLLGGLLHTGIFSWLILAHVFPIAPSLWSIPPPTVVMLFFFWILPPIYFVILYVVGFDRWILTEESLRRFRQWVQSRKGTGRG